MAVQPGIAEAPAAGTRGDRAWYRAPLTSFLSENVNDILGQLTINSGLAGFPVDPEQTGAWVHQVTFLQSAFQGLAGSIALEFSIPRMGRRIDVAVLSGPIVFAIEFKVGSKTFDRSSLDQVWDYALDLKNFHKGSHSAAIVPILVATEAEPVHFATPKAADDGVFEPLKANNSQLRSVIDGMRAVVSGATLDMDMWVRAPYQPTPTIIEAARSLYSRHSVEDIARHDAAAVNLRLTSRRVEELAEYARQHGRKAICFVTGVPGAGKTLVGLNVATRHQRKDEPTHAVFLSGNGPLVAVLSEALARDEVARQAREGKKVRKGAIRESIKAFIQNIHHFRDEGLRSPDAPDEHVVIFDEAQRAWNRDQTANFMARKKKVPGFSQSEPEFLISYMDRHQDWALIVCLVGGGQEINRGEAGIGAWLDAVETTFRNWDVYISPRLTDTEYAAGHALERMHTRPGVHFDEALHLSVPMRSFRAETVSNFVKALLDCDDSSARSYLEQATRYPIVLTRNLDKAKDWVRSQARGSERFGLLASSKAQRLKPHAIDVRFNIDPVMWFLNDKDDTRSSYYLEDAATEFQVQGLEVDWACVTWDGDLRHQRDGSWSYHDFRGSNWCRIANESNKQYLKNAYRVLLTRARQGMAIFVPPGDKNDPTRNPDHYDLTFQYLERLGIPTLE